LNPKVFIFAPNNKDMVEQLRMRAKDWTIESFDSLADLVAQAARPLASQDTLLVVYVSSEDTMNDLGRFLAGSLDFDLVVLIEDDEPALAQAALAARPRMVLTGKPDPEAMAAVLERMHPRMVQRAALLSA